MSPQQQTSASGGSQQIHTPATVTVSNRQALEEECSRQGTQGLAMGGIGSGAITYALHKIMESQSPAYVTSSKNVKMALAVGIMGVGAYFTGRYMENKCRNERGLPLV